MFTLPGTTGNCSLARIQVKQDTSIGYDTYLKLSCAHNPRRGGARDGVGSLNAGGDTDGGGCVSVTEAVA